MKIILASNSPRRRTLLSLSGIECIPVPSEAIELDLPDKPEDTVRQNAEAKARLAARAYPRAVIIAADTVVFLDGILGKPESMAQAREMLVKLGGRIHTVHTAVTVTIPQRLEICTKVAVSRVKMKTLDEKTITEYFQLVDPLDKAGGYAVQEHGDLLIEKIEGSLSNIIGLPLETLEKILALYPETRRYVAGVKEGRKRLERGGKGKVSEFHVEHFTYPLPVFDI